MTTSRIVRGVGAVLLAAGAACSIGPGVASASTGPVHRSTCPAGGCQTRAIATFPNRDACESRAKELKSQNPLQGYFCSSNGNPAVSDNSYTLYVTNYTPGR